MDGIIGEVLPQSALDMLMDELDAEPDRTWGFDPDAILDALFGAEYPELRL